MGMIELVVAMCLQAEPAACRITRTALVGSPNSCASADSESVREPGWYMARWTCRWRR
ncbi:MULTISPECIES: hypothetical protein [Methylopila]|nr:hypothetical protein [Methylopila turkensis]